MLDTKPLNNRKKREKKEKRGEKCDFSSDRFVAIVKENFLTHEIWRVLPLDSFTLFFIFIHSFPMSAKAPHQLSSLNFHLS